MRVIAVHLLNDYSGSPKVLKQLLTGWANSNVSLHLFTCGGRAGFLSDIAGVHNHFYWYTFAKNPFIRLFFLCFSQLLLGCKLLLFLRKNDVVYINTVLPFGAAIAGKIRGNKVIYHIHETSMKPALLKRFLFGVVKFTADDVVYVSKFLSEQEPLKIKKHIIHNALEREFTQAALLTEKRITKNKVVLMICSLKAYKGVGQFVLLAKLNPQYTFKLIVNASVAEIETFFISDALPINLIILPTQVNTHPFYREASVVLNLSDTNLWVETFGLTVLEAMAYGLPTIVPPVGGVTELVDENKNGYLVDSKNLNAVSEALNKILGDEELYKQFSGYARQKSELFSLSTFEEKSLRLIS